MAKRTIEEQLCNYIDKVCLDAIRAVNSDGVLDHWHMIVGKDLIVDIRFTKEPSGQMDREDVMRRVMYRLGNNIPKHFQLNVQAPHLSHYCIEKVGNLYQFFPNGEFNYGYALAEVHPFGEDMVLCHEFGYPVYPVKDDETVAIDDLPSSRLQKNGLNIYDRYFFSDFYAAYVKTFGEDPLTVWVQMRNGEDISKIGTTEAIENTANHDLDIYGCKYYSVCCKACKSCTATDRCYREKPIMKDGLVLSRYRDFKQELLMGKM